jgi:hypothetical protein
MKEWYRYATEYAHLRHRTPKPTENNPREKAEFDGMFRFRKRKDQEKNERKTNEKNTRTINTNMRANPVG